MNGRGQVVAAMRNGAVVFDSEGRYTDVNESFLNLTGYDRERVIGATLGLLHDRVDIGRITRATDRLQRSGGGGHEVVTAVVETAADERVPVEIDLSPLTGDDGSIRGTIGVVRDISDRDVREHRLNSYEHELERYERLVEVMGDGVYALDADGRYTMVNEYLLDMVGEDRKTVLGETPSLFHDDVDIDAFESAIESLLNGTSSIETVETTIETDGDETIAVAVNLTLLPRDDGEFNGTVGVVRDITEQKRRERELERYQRLIEATGDAVYALNTEGEFTFSNGAHQAIVDRDEAELLGEHAAISLPDEAVEDGRGLISELLASDRRCSTYEMNVLRPDGELIRTENHVALLTDEAGEFRGTVGVLRDITERKQRERELRRQNERLEQFASVVSHDLRNPLNVAQGYLTEIDDPAAGAVDQSLDRMETIIEEVLELARQGQTIDDPEPVPIEETVRAAWGNVETGALTLVVEVTGCVLADRNRLVTLFENLFRNSVEHAAAEEVVVGTDAGVDFSVADDGTGIPDGDREAVFEMGRTTSQTGTGFGLAIVAEIAAAHGWNVAVTEGRDGGARFEFSGVEQTVDEC
ncbi:PAS domain S-box protein [Natrinema marinum]|uniref:PAS domain S-box protein n=1 Tax=Natrinema marinum TaxID=2961598 RepID=UPI0020C8ABA0|nr:PAS domain S-box protein [Natrinema marinum]